MTCPVALLYQTMPRAKPKLAYAPKRPAHQLWIRRGALMLAVLAIGGVITALSPVALRHYRLIQLQKRCLEYVPPPNQVALEFQPNAAPHSVTPPDWSSFSAAFSPALALQS